MNTKVTSEGINWGTFRRKATPYVFVAPFFISFLIFSTFPIFYSFVLSLNSWDGSRPLNYVENFVGLNNYVNVLKDPLFWQSFVNTVAMAIITAIPQHFLGLFFAFILNQGFVKLKEFFKGVLFLPYITSSIAIGLVFNVLYGNPYGLLNYALASLEKLGIAGPGTLIPLTSPINWIREFTWVAIASLAIWRWTGWNAIIYFAGLQAIPDNLYEAARIDGANWAQVFFKITLPLLRPMILFATTMTIIGQVQLFDDPMVIVGGVGAMPTVSNRGMTLAIYLYANAFSWARFGIAAAVSWIVFFIIVFLSIINRRVFQKKD